MPQIRVQYAALDAGALTLQLTYAKLQAQIADLEAAVQPMLTMWEGDTREAYFSCQQMWRTSAEDLGLLVNMVKDGVIEANELAQARERTNRNMFPV